MPVLDVENDLDRLTITVVAEFAASPEQVWQLYADPRRIERHWGPPSWPATFLQHELEPGTRTHYFMSGPDGQQAHGVWNVVAVDEPRSFEVDDAFADAEGNPQEEPGWTRMAVRFDPTPVGTRVTLVSSFASTELFQQMLAMGMDEGLREAMDQIDGILADRD